MNTSVFGPCTVCGAAAGGNQMLCSFDEQSVLQARAVLCPRCRRRVLRRPIRCARCRGRGTTLDMGIGEHVECGLCEGYGVVRHRLVRPRLDTPWPGWVHLGSWLRGNGHIRAWPHVRARGGWLGRHGTGQHQ